MTAVAAAPGSEAGGMDALLEELQHWRSWAAAVALATTCGGSETVQKLCPGVAEAAAQLRMTTVPQGLGEVCVRARVRVRMSVADSPQQRATDSGTHSMMWVASVTPVTHTQPH